MKKIIILAGFAFLLSSGAQAADLITRNEVTKFHLSEVGKISVMDTQGAVSSPSDLHAMLGKKADALGGKYYVITAARQHGPNFEAAAIVYK